MCVYIYIYIYIYITPALQRRPAAHGELQGGGAAYGQFS